MKLFYYSKKKNHTSDDTDKLIKESLNGYLGKEISVQVKRTPAGKPYLEGCSLHIGVTHTDDIIIIAINEKPFGIDCESIDRTVNNLTRIAGKYYSESEKKYVFETSTDNEQVRRHFLEIWVKKEAYVKFTGEGLSAISRYDVTSLCGFKLIENRSNLLIYIYEED
jgi:4'-phosphopantetheinyl transferase